MSSRVGMNAEKTIKNRSPNLYNQIFICNTFLLLVQYLHPPQNPLCCTLLLNIVVKPKFDKQIKRLRFLCEQRLSILETNRFDIVWLLDKIIRIPAAIKFCC